MIKPDLGIKRVCPSCAARFYDLQKRPIECPKCAFTFEPEALLKQRRTRVPEPAPKAAEVEAESEEEEVEEAGAEELDETLTEEDAEGEAVTDDAAPVAEVEAEGDEAEPAAPDEAADAEDFEEEIDDDDDEDDNLLEEVEEDEDDVSGIIDADIEKDEP